MVDQTDRAELRRLVNAERQALAEMQASVGEQGADVTKLDAWIKASGKMATAARVHFPALLDQLDAADLVTLPCKPGEGAGEAFLDQLRRVNSERYEAWITNPIMLCEHCGADASARSPVCKPPFDDQPHSFTRPHPYLTIRNDAGIMFDALELGGEVGELLNVVKKLEREERGWRGSRASSEDFADECADVLICLDKLARRKGVDLAAATIAKFNATSEKVDLPHRLSTPDATQTREAEPFGYWIEQKHAEPALLRKPAYIPEPSELRTVTPLYAAQTRKGEVDLRKAFRDAAKGYGRAGTADLPGGPDMSMDDAAEVYAELAANTPSIVALVQWARDQQAFPENSPGGSGRGHIDENHRFRLRDMVAGIDIGPLTAQIDRIKEAVEQYRNAPFRSADWLAGELMTILDTEAANDRN